MFKIFIKENHLSYETRKGQCVIFFEDKEIESESVSCPRLQFEVILS